MFEVEKKYKVDVIPARFDFSNLGVDIVDTYYQHPSWDFSLNGEWFRVRDNGPNTIPIITYKGQKYGDSRKELEFGMIDSEAVRIQGSVKKVKDLINVLGFTELVTVRKNRRQHFDYPGREFFCSIYLDDVVDLGKFIEIEMLVQDESLIADVEKQLEDIAKQVGLTNQCDLGYAEMMLLKLKETH